MDETILSSVCEYLGLDSEDRLYKVEILSLINGAVLALSQIGACKYHTVTEDTTWDVLIDNEDVEAIKLYVQLKTKVIFDPPSTSAVMEAMNNFIREIEWRLQTQVQEGRSDE